MKKKKHVNADLLKFYKSCNNPNQENRNCFITKRLKTAFFNKWCLSQNFHRYKMFLSYNKKNSNN